MKRCISILFMLFFISSIFGCGVCHKVTRDGTEVDWLGINTFNPEDKCGDVCKNKVERKDITIDSYKSMIEDQSVEYNNLELELTFFKQSYQKIESTVRSVKQKNKDYEIEINRLKEQLNVYKKKIADIENVSIIHKVIAGEWLSKLAIKYYKDMKLWPLIYWANAINDSELIFIGQELLIPHTYAKKEKQEAINWHTHIYGNN